MPRPRDVEAKGDEWGDGREEGEAGVKGGHGGQEQEEEGGVEGGRGDPGSDATVEYMSDSESDASISKESRRRWPSRSRWLCVWCVRRLRRACNRSGGGCGDAACGNCVRDVLELLGAMWLLLWAANNWTSRYA